MADSHPRHSRATRLVHMGLALAVIVQLTSSLVFEPPSPDGTANVWWEVHEYGGLTAFGFVLLFWLVLVGRNHGTDPGSLFPWFSASRMRGVWADMKLQLKALTGRHLPRYDAHGPFASAIHGLGLLLMTAMATTGTVYYFINTGNPDAGGLVGAVMFVHRGLSNLVWVYLIGHASLAVLHHFTDHMSLREMWSLSRNPRT